MFGYLKIKKVIKRLSKLKCCKVKETTKLKAKQSLCGRDSSDYGLNYWSIFLPSTSSIPLYLVYLTFYPI